MAKNRQPTPLQAILQPNLDSVFSIANGQAVTRAGLLSHALQLSRQLPDKCYAVNLCHDRYLFTVAFLAVVIRSQVNLLPPNQASNSVSRLLSDYPQSYCIIDSPKNLKGERFFLDHHKLSNCDDGFPLINTDQVVSISFTSGSTGEPKQIEKTWRELHQSAQLAINRFALNEQQLMMISTVPPQHMYGLESSVFWPLFSRTAVSNCRPFFPEDIRQLITATNIPCLLASTPAHLKACVRAGLKWENIAMVLSSTAPMPHELAGQIEHSFQAPLFEIFGSTETLSYASRQTTKTKKWKPYQDILITNRNNRCFVQGGHLDKPVLLDDQFDVDHDGLFTVAGRCSDLIKIAGKRASLTELNRIINAIEGVEEGLFYQTENERLGALVVTQLSRNEILSELRKSIDEVFLPRPFHRVEKIPRNELGKIVKIKLDRFIKELYIA